MKFTLSMLFFISFCTKPCACLWCYVCEGLSNSTCAISFDRRAVGKRNCTIEDDPNVSGCLKVVLSNYSMIRGCTINVNCDAYELLFKNFILECVTCDVDYCNKGDSTLFLNNLKSSIFILILREILLSCFTGFS